RQGWERIEPIAALVEEIDGKVDARVDDFESETDPAWTGWHRIEYILWEENTTEGAVPLADQLDADLQTLQDELPDIELTGLAMARGAAELIEELDGKVDARVDDFTGEDDPAWTGWHRLEYILWETGSIDDSAKALADQLDADLAVLVEEVAGLDIPPAVIAVGSFELLEEAANGKLTGEEDRYSHTDMWDIAANVEGSEQAFELLEPAVEEQDPELVERIEAGFDEAEELVEAQADGSGYVPFDQIDEAAINEMKAALAQLSEDLSLVAGVLGLE
ncbi:MAG: imelysin family protein, partial [Ilumatobacteraceae bacterium]